MLQHETYITANNLRGMDVIINSKGQRDNMTLHIWIVIETATNAAKIQYTVSAFKGRVDSFEHAYDNYSEAVNKYNELLTRWNPLRTLGRI